MNYYNNTPTVPHTGDAEVVSCGFHVWRADGPEHHQPDRHGPRGADPRPIRNPSLQKEQSVVRLSFIHDWARHQSGSLCHLVQNQLGILQGFQNALNTAKGQDKLDFFCLSLPPPLRLLTHVS